MIKIHTENGETTNLALEEETQVDSLQRFQNDSKRITGITAVQSCSGHLKCPNHVDSDAEPCKGCSEEKPLLTCKMGIQHSLSRPVGFNEVSYGVERTNKGSEKIVCIADDCKIVVMINHNQPSSKITIIKKKTVQRFKPSGAKCEFTG